MRLISHLLVGLSLISFVELCVFRYNSSVPSFYKKFDCKAKDCFIDILPSATQAIQLQINTKFPHNFQVFTYYSTPGQNKTKVLKGSYNTSRTYYARPDEGLYFRRTNGSCKASFVPDFKFVRVAAERAICDPIVAKIDHNVWAIQRRKSTRIVDNCPYHVIPAKSKSDETETLYLLSPNNVTIQATLNGVETNKKSGRLIAVRNWTAVDFTLKHEQENRYESVEMAPVFAVSTKKNCSCDVKEDKSENSIIFHTPGYPDFLCPSRTCSGIASFEPANITEDFVERKMVTIYAQSWRGVSLHLHSPSWEITFDESNFHALQSSFIVPEEDLEFTYTTAQQLHIGEEGHVQMEIKQVVLQKDCSCSTFLDKIYAGDYNKIIRIPSHCELLFCDWTIAPNDQDMKKEVFITLENGQDGDEVQIWNKQLIETYEHEQLLHPRKLYLTDITDDAHLIFWRKHAGEEAALHISINNVEATECTGDEHYLLDTTPYALSSSNYPMPYNSGSCKILFEAPENHVVNVLITDMETENFHDELVFHDGETSSSEIISHLSGEHKGLSITSTGNFMFIDFNADDHDSRAGFHFVATAVPHTDLVDQTTESPAQPENNSDMEDHANFTAPLIEGEDPEDPDVLTNNTGITSSKTSHRKLRLEVPNINENPGFLYALLLMVMAVVSAIAIMAGFSYFKQKLTKSTVATSFDNANVRYRTEDNESIVTIENADSLDELNSP